MGRQEARRFLRWSAHLGRRQTRRFLHCFDPNQEQTGILSPRACRHLSSEDMLGRASKPEFALRPFRTLASCLPLRVLFDSAQVLPSITFTSELFFQRLSSHSKIVLASNQQYHIQCQAWHSECLNYSRGTLHSQGSHFGTRSSAFAL